MSKSSNKVNNALNSLFDELEKEFKHVKTIKDCDDELRKLKSN